MFYVLKGYFTQEWKFCHHLLTLMSFQTRNTFVMKSERLSIDSPHNYHFDALKSS